MTPVHLTPRPMLYETRPLESRDLLYTRVSRTGTELVTMSLSQHPDAIRALR